MNNHSVAEYLLNGKPIGKDGAECVALIAKEGRQVAGVKGMDTVSRIVMCADGGKGILIIPGAISIFMDVESKDRIFAGAVSSRQPKNLIDDQNPACNRVKEDSSPDRRVFLTSADSRTGARLAGKQKLEQILHSLILILFHFIHLTPLYAVNT